jgi:hypothetical protein
MLRRDEVVQSLTGAWELFLDRPDAMRFFDVSADGFWRSFYAIILIVPAYTLISIFGRSQILVESVVAAQFDDSAFIINKSVALGFEWIALPVILALAAPALGIGQSYAAFIIARNWGAALSNGLAAIVPILFLVGFIGDVAANFIFFAILIVVIRYNFLIARRALDANIGLAIGIVIGDIAISLAIFSTINRFISYAPVML